MQCKQLVKDYLPQLLQAVMDMPLDQICASIGLCPASSKAIVNQHRRQLFNQAGDGGRHFIRSGTTSAATHMGKASRDMILPGWERLAASASKQSGDEAVGSSAVCDFCQTSVQYIKIALESNETVAQVCGRLTISPARLHQACQCEHFTIWVLFTSINFFPVHG